MGEFGLDSTCDTFIDQDEINQTIIKKLNSLFGNNVANLKKAIPLAEELKASKKKLEKELLLSTTEAPNRVTNAIKSVNDVIEENEELHNKIQTLQEQMEELEASSEPLLDIIRPHLNIIEEGERVEAYKKWIISIEELSLQIETSLKSGSEDEALCAYNKLRESSELICQSECVHLKQHTCKKASHFHNLLMEAFQGEFSSLLKKIKWPFLTSLNHPPLSQELVQKFEQVTHRILTLHIPSCVLSAAWDTSVAQPPSSVLDTTDDPSFSMPSLVADFKVSVIPLLLLLKPLEIRFLYHFSGNKATNSRENPEWYLTQVLKWITNHEAFLEEYFQPILNKNGLEAVNAKVEFMKGLVRLIALKLSSDLPDIQREEDLFCRTIQETLNFERELRVSLGYPAGQPSVLAVLTQATVFNKWISLEQKFALELMDEFVSSNTAWQSEESGGISQCGEQLILILQGITDRYKSLPQPGHRLQFLDLQLELLDDFRVRLLQMTKSELPDLLQSNYISILNTVYHISTTLMDWSDMPFFIEMQFFKERFGTLQKSLIEVPSNQVEESLVDYSMNASFVSTVSPRDGYLRQDALASLNLSASKPKPSDLLEVNGSAFEETLQLYSHIETEMLSTLCKHILTEVQARSQGYRRNKWFLGSEDSRQTATKGGGVYEISPAFCPLLEVLMRNLHCLKEGLAPQLFTKSWQAVAQALNKFIYEEVILQNTFSEKGASQLEYDLTKGLYPIFGEYTPKPIRYFTLLRETLILLVMPRPTALLLKDTLKLAHNEDKDFSLLGISPVRALEERGVFRLSVQEAEVLLNIRTNMVT